MICIQVGIARKSGEIIPVVAHVWNDTTQGAAQKAHDICQLSTEGAKINRVLEPGLEPRDLALGARTLELGYGLRRRQRRQRPMNWRKSVRF